MQAEHFIAKGDLTAALAALQDHIRANAADPKPRIFLFQLLCVLGDWERAIKQLKLAAEMDPAAVPMAQSYRELMICEAFRARVFAGEADPTVFGTPHEWMALMVEAARAQARGDLMAAGQTRARAFAAAPAVGGTLNGAPFAWIADADMRLGPLLEVIINGRYFWMPFDAIRKASFEPPCDLRDAVWMPLTLELANGGDVVGFVPTRYPATLTQGTDAEKLARATRWIARDEDLFEGSGQREFVTDSAQIALMDMRELVIGGVDG